MLRAKTTAIADTKIDTSTLTARESKGFLTGRDVAPIAPVPIPKKTLVIFGIAICGESTSPKEHMSFWGADARLFKVIVFLDSRAQFRRSAILSQTEARPGLAVLL
ncbi:MAG: hypothetical protein V3T05_11570 [Myxococcota bacterium]